MLAFKIFPDDHIDNLKSLMTAVVDNQPNAGIELAFYNTCQMSPELSDFILSLPSKHKSLHSDHQKVSLIGLGSVSEKIRTKADEALLNEYQHIKDLNIKKYIIHGGVSDVYEHNFKDYGYRDVEMGIKKITSLGLTPLLEKTFESIAWFENIFEQAPLTLGFCLDIGHVKLWEKDTLENWMLFVDKINDKGHPIHFHIHNNDGTNDQHVNLSKSFVEGFLVEDDTYCHTNVLEWFKKTHQKYGEVCLFTMESYDALDAYPFVKMVLDLE